MGTTVAKFHLTSSPHRLILAAAILGLLFEDRVVLRTRRRHLALMFSQNGVLQTGTVFMTMPHLKTIP
jgi:hypothetical protein